MTSDHEHGEERGHHEEGQGKFQRVPVGQDLHVGDDSPEEEGCPVDQVVLVPVVGKSDKGLTLGRTGHRYYSPLGLNSFIYYS